MPCPDGKNPTEVCTGQEATAQPVHNQPTGAARPAYVSRDFITGLDRCQDECAFFDFCRVSRQALVTAVSNLATAPKG